MTTGFRGTFAISWSQTEIDGLDAAPVHALRVGAAWSWRGDVLPAETATGRPLPGRHGLSDRSFTVTDGAQSYTARLAHAAPGAPPVLTFAGQLPPRDTELWIARGLSERDAPAPEAVICFTPGTAIATPTGQRRVETLRVGDPVLTKDNGPQPVQWIGRRHMDAAMLFAHPAFRPVRIRAGALGVERPDQELLVSPQHRMLIRSDAARDLFRTRDVLIAAKDLTDGRMISVDLAVQEVTYIHLLLPGHNLLWANGVLTESFHPASAALHLLGRDDRAELDAAFPILAKDPRSYGPHARRNLSKSEAAILRHAA